MLPAKITALKIRHHGDFHLGQILIAKDDAYILDFEGEPGRSLDERRQKAPAARDVAGLIRSIDYSTTAALLNAANLTPEERATLPPKLAVWRDKATEEFWNTCRDLHRYLSVARGRPGGAEPARFLPARKSLLRNGIRADEPSGVAARSP